MEYFTFQNIFSDRTMYKDVRLLSSGTYLEVDLSSVSDAFSSSSSPLSFELSAFSFHKYWDYNFHEPYNIKDEREYVEELNRLFVQAVERQLVSDVEVGSSMIPKFSWIIKFQ